MSITMHLFYTGKDGSARRFAEEMEHSGTADRIRAEDGNEGYVYYLPMNAPERSGFAGHPSRLSYDEDHRRPSRKV